MKIRIGKTAEDPFDIFASRDVILQEKERYKGVLVVSPPGGGKSTFILNCMYQDLMFRMCACFLIDPSGQLAREAYTLAKQLKRDVTYLSNENPCIGLNLMMAPYSPQQRAELIIAYLNHITLTTSSDDTTTTRMRNVVYDEVINCIDKGQPRLDALLDRLRHKRDNKNQYAIDGVVARLESILSDPSAEDTLCSEASLNPLEFIKERKTLIVDTYGYGKLPSVAVGSALTFLIRESLMSVRRESYDPLALYIDEAHLYLNETWLDILKMGRKFRIMPVLALQDVATVPHVLEHVMLSNIQTIIAMQPGMRESRVIADEFYSMDARQVKFTNQYTAAVKTPSFEGVVEMLRPPFVVPLPAPVMQVCHERVWFPSV